MLQKADPTGEGFIRMEGGIPCFAESKAGYWDGPYTYLDEDGNFVLSTMGYKIDISCISVWDFVERLVNINDPDNWKNIERKFKFDLTYSYEPHRYERADLILKEAREAFDYITQIKENSYNKYLKEAVLNAEKGWTWFQNKDVDKGEIPNYHVHYTWKIFNEAGKSEGSNVANTESIIKSGLWEKLDNNKIKGFYEWVKI